MRSPLDFTLLQSIPARFICTLAPPANISLSKPCASLRTAPPILVAKSRTQLPSGDSFLLLSSLEPQASPIPHKPHLGPARQVAAYCVSESVVAHPEQGPMYDRKWTMNITKALRRFVEPAPNADLAALGAWGPRRGKSAGLSEMLQACLESPEGTRGLLRADVVAGREVIKKLMFPHKAAFNASFARGVLFLDEVDGPETSKFDHQALKRERGFFRACTEMYTKGWIEDRAGVDRSVHTLHSVVGRSLGGLNLLMSGSVDCTRSKYHKDPRCYMQLVTKQLRDGKYLIRPKTFKEWYIRAHIMGIPSLYLGIVDEAGVLQSARALATRSLPRFAAEAGVPQDDFSWVKLGSARAAPWDPQDAFTWAFRVLAALRDYCQEAADLHGVRATPRSRRNAPDSARAVWRVEIMPVGEETRVLVRELRPESDELPEGGGRYGIVPNSVVKAFEGRQN